MQSLSPEVKRFQEIKRREREAAKARAEAKAHEDQIAAKVKAANPSASETVVRQIVQGALKAELINGQVRK